MNTSQLRELPTVELEAMIIAKRSELFKLRMQVKFGIQSKTDLVKKTRRSIAQLLTIISEKVSHNASKN